MYYISVYKSIFGLLKILIRNLIKLIKLNQIKLIG